MHFTTGGLLLATDGLVKVTAGVALVSDDLSSDNEKFVACNCRVTCTNQRDEGERRSISCS